ncbi:MAG: AMP-binding protein, partial [Rhodospirillales bacterium]|nr:AMP-binding protein [Rhodospirillales bacterium]
MPVLLNAGEILRAHARLRPGATGARDLERTLTYAQWNTRACRLANALLGLGLAKGARVAVLSYNRLEWAEIYAAVAKAGLVAVPINFRLTAAEAAYIIKDCEAAAILVEDALRDTIEAIRADLDLLADRYILFGSEAAAGYKAYEDLLATAAATEPETVVASHDPWCLMYTSGTTGNPKGAIRGHADMAMVGLMSEIEFRLHRRDNTLLVMPMCHANSLNFFTASLYCGATVSIFSRSSFDPDLCLAALGEGVTFSSLVPTHYAMMQDVASAHQVVRSVEKLVVSSATAFAETKRAIMEMFPNSELYELYGSTEAAWVTTLHPDEQFDHLGTVGREVVGSAPVRLLDEDGNEVPDGEPGELFSSSPYQFQGYWNLPEQTEAAFRGGYLSVGDVAVRDADGYIRLLDRKKNLIISGGENIYPTEVEQVLSAHPDIRDVAVVGVADPKWSQRVVAAVVPRPGPPPDARTLMDWSRDGLPRSRGPRGSVCLGA